MIIAIDIDDTMTNLRAHFVNMITKEFKKNNDTRYIDKTERLFQTMTDWNGSECDDFIKLNSKELFADILPKNDVVDVLNRLKREGHTLVVISARSKLFFNDPYELTFEWLNKNNIPFDKLIIAAEEKQQFCLDNNIDILLDDSTSVLSKVYDAGVKVVMMRVPHNKIQDDYDFDSVENFEQFYDYINKLNFKAEVV